MQPVNCVFFHFSDKNIYVNFFYMQAIFKTQLGKDKMNVLM